MNMKSDIDAALEKGDEFEKGQNICIISGPKGDELLKKHGANGRFTCDCEACHCPSRQIQNMDPPDSKN